MCDNLHDIASSTLKNLARMSSTSTPTNTTRTRKTNVVFGLGEVITEADGTITS